MLKTIALSVFVIHDTELSSKLYFYYLLNLIIIFLKYALNFPNFRSKVIKFFKSKLSLQNPKCTKNIRTCLSTREISKHFLENCQPTNENRFIKNRLVSSACFSTSNPKNIRLEGLSETLK